MSPLTDQTVTEFETATFECEIQKTKMDNVKVKWFKGQEELVKSRRCEMMRLGSRLVLSLKEAQMEDMEEYTVKVEEGVESKAKLTVKGN